MSPGDQGPFCGLLASLLKALKKIGKKLKMVRFLEQAAGEVSGQPLQLLEEKVDHRGGEHPHERRKKGMTFDLEFVVVCKKVAPKGIGPTRRCVLAEVGVPL